MQQAVDILKRAHALDDQNPDAVVAIGRCLEKMGNLEEAINYYEGALLLPMTNLNAYFYLAVIYEKKKEYNRSI